MRALFQKAFVSLGADYSTADDLFPGAAFQWPARDEVSTRWPFATTSLAALQLPDCLI